MQSQNWHPLVPSHHLRSGENIVAGFMHGEELALWRSASGTVQAWENRCPHRGTRLTLGRIINDRLSCAYHGWEFDAKASCAAIPANPSMPVPKQLRVKAYPVVEVDGMVWVAALGTELPSNDATKPSVSGSAFFVQSLVVRATISEVAKALGERGFQAAGSHRWHGLLDGHASTVWLNAATPQSTTAHIWLDERPAHDWLATATSAARMIRRDIETRTAARSPA